MSSTSTPRRRLVRRTDDRIVAGVASGTADYLNIDPVLARVGFVVLTFAGGLGIVLYAALWLLAPADTDPTPRRTDDRERGAAFWIAIGLFVLAAFALADAVASRLVLWPLVLIGAGVALWRSDLGRERTPESPTVDAGAPTFDAGPSSFDAGPPSGDAGPAGAGTTRGDDVTADLPAAAPPPADPARGQDHPTAPLQPATVTSDWTPPPPPGAGGATPSSPPPSRPDSRVRERSPLGRLTVGAALLVVGFAAILDRTGVIDLSVRDGVALALLVVGLGLVVGAWAGRARWLALPGLLLVPILVVSTAVTSLGVNLDAGVGEKEFGVGSVAELAPRYELGVGRMEVDLSRLELAGGERATTELRLGIGELEVFVPPDVTVEVVHDVTGGRVKLFGQSIGGQPVRGTEIFPGVEGAGTLVLDIGVGLGEAEVSRVDDPAGSLLPDTDDGFAGFDGDEDNRIPPAPPEPPARPNTNRTR